MRALSLLLVITALACIACKDQKPAAVSSPPSAPQPMVWSEPVWGETNAGLQLSLSASPEKIKPGERLTLRFNARNLTSSNLVFDAQVPMRNGSRIRIVYPDGKLIDRGASLDMLLHLSLAPGESYLGDFASETWLDRSDYNPEMKGEAKFDNKRLRGLHTITWMLKGTSSNTVNVNVE